MAPLICEAARSFGWVYPVGALISDGLSPPRCGGCDVRVRRRAAFCSACASTAERAALTETPGITAAFVYGGCIARALTRFKYENRPDLAWPLAALLGHALQEARHGPYDAVIPVPLHASRLHERRYNQSALLAGPVARTLGAPMSVGVLFRTRRTLQQATLDRAGRARNVAGAFTVSGRRGLAGARLLLVDDVRTTGATLEACAHALHGAGVRQVDFAVVARSDG